MKVKDYRIIKDVQSVIISQCTASDALDAMKLLRSQGRYDQLMRDDASFIGYEIAELEKAVQEREK